MWSHLKELAHSSKVKTTLNSMIEKVPWESICSVAFVWMVTLQDFILIIRQSLSLLQVLTFSIGCERVQSKDKNKKHFGRVADLKNLRPGFTTLT